MLIIWQEAVFAYSGGSSMQQASSSAPAEVFSTFLALFLLLPMWPKQITLHLMRTSLIPRVLFLHVFLVIFLCYSWQYGCWHSNFTDIDIYSTFILVEDSENSQCRYIIFLDTIVSLISTTMHIFIVSLLGELNDKGSYKYAMTTL